MPAQPSYEAEESWTVHVNGPDDILDAKDYADAVRQANEINKWYEEHSVPTRTEFHPYCWAIPVRKGYYSYPMKSA